MIKKLVSLFVCATLLITPILPVYAQTDVQLSAPSGVFHSPQLEKQLKLEILRQQVTPKALSRLNGYCAQMVTCTEQVSADGYATLLMDEAAYKQELLALAGKKNVDLRDVNLTESYHELRAKELLAYNQMLRDLELIYKMHNKESATVSKLVAEVLPSALAMGIKTPVTQEVGRGIYKDYFGYLNAKYRTVSSLQNKGIAELNEGHLGAKNTLSQVLPGTLTGYGFIADKEDLRLMGEFVGKSAVSPYAAQTVVPYISILLGLKEYKTAERFLKVASVLEVKTSEKGEFWEGILAITSILTPSAYFKESNEAEQTRYAGGHVSKYGFYVKNDNTGLVGNVWEDAAELLAEDGSTEALAVLNNVFYNGLVITSSANLTPKATWTKGVLIPFALGAIKTRQLDKRALEGHGAFKKYFGSNLNLLGAAELSLLTYKFCDLDNANYLRVRHILTEPYQAAINGTLSPELAERRLNFNVHSSNGRSRSGYNGMIYNPDTHSGLIINETPAMRAKNLRFYGDVTKYLSVLDTAVGVVLTMQMVKGVMSLQAAAKNLKIALLATRNNLLAEGNANTIWTWLKAVRAVALRKPLLTELSRLETLKKQAVRNPNALNRAKAEVTAARIESRISAGVLQKDAAVLFKEQNSIKLIAKKVELKQPLNAKEAKVWAHIQRYSQAQNAVRSTQRALKNAQEVKAGDYFDAQYQARQAGLKADVKRMNEGHASDLKTFNERTAVQELAKKKYLSTQEGKAAQSLVTTKGPSPLDRLLNQNRLVKTFNKQATTLSLSLLLSTLSPSVSSSAVAVSSISRNFKPLMELVDPRTFAQVVNGRAILLPASLWKPGMMQSVQTPTRFVTAAKAELGFAAANATKLSIPPELSSLGVMAKTLSVNPAQMRATMDKAALVVLAGEVIKEFSRQNASGVFSLGGLGWLVDHLNTLVQDKTLLSQITRSLEAAIEKATLKHRQSSLWQQNSLRAYYQFLAQEIANAFEEQPGLNPVLKERLVQAYLEEISLLTLEEDFKQNGKILSEQVTSFFDDWEKTLRAARVNQEYNQQQLAKRAYYQAALKQNLDLTLTQAQQAYELVPRQQRTIAARQQLILRHVLQNLPAAHLPLDMQESIVTVLTNKILQLVPFSAKTNLIENAHILEVTQTQRYQPTWQDGLFELSLLLEEPGYVFIHQQVSLPILRNYLWKGLELVSQDKQIISYAAANLADAANHPVQYISGDPSVHIFIKTLRPGNIGEMKENEFVAFPKLEPRHLSEVVARIKINNKDQWGRVNLHNGELFFTPRSVTATPFSVFKITLPPHQPPQIQLIQDGQTPGQKLNFRNLKQYSRNEMPEYYQLDSYFEQPGTLYAPLRLDLPNILFTLYNGLSFSSRWLLPFPTIPQPLEFKPGLIPLMFKLRNLPVGRNVGNSLLYVDTKGLPVRFNFLNVQEPEIQNPQLSVYDNRVQHAYFAPEEILETAAFLDIGNGFEWGRLDLNEQVLLFTPYRQTKTKLSQVLSVNTKQTPVKPGPSRVVYQSRSILDELKTQRPDFFENKNLFYHADFVKNIQHKASSSMILREAQRLYSTLSFGKQPGYELDVKNPFQWGVPVVYRVANPLPRWLPNPPLIRFQPKHIEETAAFWDAGYGPEWGEVNLEGDHAVFTPYRVLAQQGKTRTELRELIHNGEPVLQTLSQANPQFFELEQFNYRAIILSDLYGKIGRTAQLQKAQPLTQEHFKVSSYEPEKLFNPKQLLKNTVVVYKLAKAPWTSRQDESYEPYLQLEIAAFIDRGHGFEWGKLLLVKNQLLFTPYQESGGRSNTYLVPNR